MGTTCSKNEEFSLFRPGEFFEGGGKKFYTLSVRSACYHADGKVPPGWQKSPKSTRQRQAHQLYIVKASPFFWGEGLLW